MKKGLLLVILLVFGWVGVASAVPYLDVNGDHSGSVWMGEYLNPSETWTFDLNNDILSVGDINAGDEILSANLAIDVNDPRDDGYFERFEFTDLMFDGMPIVSHFEVNDVTYNLDVLAWVSDHILNVTLSNVQSDDWTSGNFCVASIELSGEYAPVPEPATLLLLGSGLAGLAFYRRKRK